MPECTLSADTSWRKLDGVLWSNECAYYYYYCYYYYLSLFIIASLAVYHKFHKLLCMLNGSLSKVTNFFNVFVSTNSLIILCIVITSPVKCQWTNRICVALRLFSNNRWKATLKYFRNKKVAHDAQLTVPLMSLSSVTHGNMESTCFIWWKWQMLVMATSSMPLFSKGSQARTNQNARMIHFVMLSTNKFHVAVLLSRDRSQMTSNEVVTKKWHTRRSQVCYRCSCPNVTTLRVLHPSASKQTNHWEKKNVERGAWNVLFERSTHGAWAAYRRHPKSSAWRANINCFY